MSFGEDILREYKKKKKPLSFGAQMITQYKRKKPEMKIDESEWMKAKEPSIGQVPEVEVTAKKPPTGLAKVTDPIVGALAEVGKFHEWATENVKQVVSPTVEAIGKVAIPTAPGAAKPIVEMATEVVKQPGRDLQMMKYWEDRSAAMQDFVHNFGTPRGTESAKRFVDIQDEMIKKNILPEQRAIQAVVEMYFNAN